MLKREFVSKKQLYYLEDHPRMKEVVNNHGPMGDCFRPLRIGLWDPFQTAFFWLTNGGDPNYLLTGMILQVDGGFKDFGNLYLRSLGK